MNRTIEDIQKDIELLGIKGGYDIEQLLTPQDCRRLSYEIERLNNIIKEVDRESYLGMIENKNNNDYAKGLFTAYKYINDKIKKLKGSEKE